MGRGAQAPFRCAMAAGAADHRSRVLSGATRGQGTYMAPQENMPTKFSKSNAKLTGQGILTFNVPAGHSCPGAMDCQTFADPDMGTIMDGPHQKFRCYAASLESIYPSLRELVWNNFNALMGCVSAEEMADMLCETMPPKWRGVRIHALGDFFNRRYLSAWCQVAARKPGMFFYAYTKSVNFLADALVHNEVPANMTVTASRGGRHDHLIDLHGLREAVVVYHPDEALSMGIEIDHDDSLARNSAVRKFALLIHGQQPSGSAPSLAQKKMRAEKIDFGYAAK